MTHRDIDFHIYSSPLRLADSFAAMARLAENNRIRIFGEGTENALLKAQEANGLTVDGICGPASWKTISGASKYL